MKKIMAVAVAILIVAIGVIWYSPVSASDKVTLCHAAGLDGTLKFTTLNIAPSAAETHLDLVTGTPQAGHENDYLGECDPEDTTTTSTTSTTTSTTSTTSTTTIPVVVTTFPPYFPPETTAPESTLATTTTTVVIDESGSVPPPVDETTTTTVPPMPDTTVPPPELADTGSEAGKIAILAGLITALGIGLTLVRRKGIAN
jgi:LPXTG-motif cell wall-anchored protein